MKKKLGVGGKKKGKKSKKDMLDKHVDINDVFLVVDDRDRVVKLWRSLGLTTFQVADGDF